MSLVNALPLATRLMMSNGAMTYSIQCRIRQPIQRSRWWGSTNLSLRDDGQKDECSGAFGTKRPENQQRAHSVKGGRLDEHGDDSLGQSTNPSHPQGRGSLPGVPDEPDDDHEGEEDIE